MLFLINLLCSIWDPSLFFIHIYLNIVKTNTALLASSRGSPQNIILMSAIAFQICSHSLTQHAGWGTHRWWTWFQYLNLYILNCGKYNA